MRVLELFCGTKSFSKAVERLVPDSEIITLEKESRFKPDILIDILDWDYTELLPFKPDVIWASCPCTEWSRAKTTGVRNLELARQLVARTLDNIDFFKPRFYIIENPVGLLQYEQAMKELDATRHTVNYCMYGNFPKKPTHLWCHGFTFEPRICQGECGQTVTNPNTGRLNHIKVLSVNTLNPGQVRGRSGVGAYPIPPALCEDLVKIISGTPCHTQRRPPPTAE